MAEFKQIKCVICSEEFIPRLKYGITIHTIKGHHRIPHFICNDCCKKIIGKSKSLGMLRLEFIPRYEDNNLSELL